MKILAMKVPVIKCYDLFPDVVAFSTTRYGGYSKGAYSTFNANYYCGDDVDDVMMNRKALCEELGISMNNLILPHQIHETIIRKIDERFTSLTDEQRKSGLEGVDGVMTKMRNVCVAVSTADCIPVLLFDPIQHVCCAVHAGWRGTVKRIVMTAIKEMASIYGVLPETLQACIGPGISLENFEVGDEVWNEFAKAGFDMEKISSKYEKWHIDLWKCNWIQLIDAGVDPRNVQIVGICTYSHADEFFSARKLSINSGRILSGIFMK